MKQPEGFVNERHPKKVIKLQRAMNGLRQGSRVFNKKIHNVMIDGGFTQSKNDPCLYMKKNEKGEVIAYVTIWVDDVIMVERRNRSR